MAIGDQEEGIVALSYDGGQKSTQSIKGKGFELLDSLGDALLTLGGLLCFSRIHILLGFVALHHIQFAFAFARCHVFL
ncbi:MAG: hypothetical protein AB7U82_15545 [Blastocatellales bacterium]